MKKIFILLALSFLSAAAFAQKWDKAMVVGVAKDTLIVKDTSIRFIRIGNDVFEVVRKVELNKVEAPSFRPLQWPWSGMSYGEGDTLRLLDNKYYLK